MCGTTIGTLAANERFYFKEGQAQPFPSKACEGGTFDWIRIEYSTSYGFAWITSGPTGGTQSQALVEPCPATPGMGHLCLKCLGAPDKVVSYPILQLFISRCPARLLTTHPLHVTCSRLPGFVWGIRAMQRDSVRPNWVQNTHLHHYYQCPRLGPAVPVPEWSPGTSCVHKD
jgi:hypothetical protein